MKRRTLTIDVAFGSVQGSHLVLDGRTTRGRGLDARVRIDADSIGTLSYLAELCITEIVKRRDLAQQNLDGLKQRAGR